MIYFDSAATSYHKPDSVYETVLSTMKNSGNSARGLNEASISATRIIVATRNKIKNYFNAPSANNVIFTSGTTESLNMAIFGLLNGGEHVITTVLEHNSVLRPLYALREKNISISYIEPSEGGVIDLKKIKKSIKINTRLVVLSHASNLIGKVNDIGEIGRFLSEKGIYFVLDAAQTAGIYDIDMLNMGISAICFSAHKSIMGIQGSGVLILNEGIKLKPLKYGGTGIETYLETMPDFYPEGLEAGSLNLPGIASILAGIEYIEDYGRDKIKAKTAFLVNEFLNYLDSRDEFIIYGEKDYKNRLATVAFNIKGFDSNKVSDILFTKYDIALRAGAHCAPLCHKYYKTVDIGMLRVSFSHFNTRNELEILINALEEIVNEQK